ncbi:MAG: hydroxymethylbilane synthase [Alphaproteobacteria bacterium]|nr:hydroxymethylbilane synthase [Alphaproteobacteria bacterium]
MTQIPPVLRIGTRGSPLALIQAGLVRDALAMAHPALAAPEAIAIEVIRTTGDKVQDRPLSEIGGKGLFTKEIEEALLAGRIDLAVHSAKDMPTVLPDGLWLSAMLPREDPRDVLFTRTGGNLASLPKGARLGTASLRRQAQLLNRRPDLVPGNLRGNVETRLRKLAEGQVDATVLALAGLKRLGRGDAGGVVLSVKEMLPAPAQGAICIESRVGDDRVNALLAAIDHEDTSRAVAAERALLKALDGSCRTPIAGLALLDRQGGLTLDALVAANDGTKLWRIERRGDEADAERLGSDAGEELRRLAGW